MADIIDVARVIDAEANMRVPTLAFPINELHELPVLQAKDYESAYYLRLTALDQPGVLATVAGIFGELAISIEAILQKEPTEPVNDLVDSDITPTVPLILLTREVKEGLIEQD